MYTFIHKLYRLKLHRLANWLAARYFPICLPCQLSGPCPVHDTDRFLAEETDLLSRGGRCYDECMACIEPERYDDHIHEDWSF